MSDAINPRDLLDAARIFVPTAQSALIDRLFFFSISGEMYALTAFLGDDLEVGEEFFILRRSVCDEKDLPRSGNWHNIDVNRTELRTIYKGRENVSYKYFQEFHDVRFCIDNDFILISRKADDFGIEKLFILTHHEMADLPT